MIHLNPFVGITESFEDRNKPGEAELRRAQRQERDRRNRDDAGEPLRSHQRESFIGYKDKEKLR